MFATLAGLCLLPFVAEASPEGVLLRHRFEEGQVLRYEVVSASEMTMQKGEASQDLSHDSTSIKRYEVVEKTEDGAVLELTIERVIMTADDPDGISIEYDSDQGDAPAQFAGVAATIGPTIARITIDERGHVSDVEDLLKLGTSAGQFERSNQHTLIQLPEQPVTVGDEWKQPFSILIRPDEDLPARTPFKLLRKYRVTKIDDGVVTIDWRAIALTPLHSPAIEAQIAHMRLQGEIEFDTRIGRVVKRTGGVKSEVVGFEGPQSLLRKTVRVAETYQSASR